MLLRPPLFFLARRVGRYAPLGASFRSLFRKCVLIIPYRYYLRRLFAKSNEITSPIGAHLPYPTGKLFSLSLLRRVLPPAFPQMRLDNTIQVLPAPPFRKIKRNYVADRVSRTRRANLFARSFEARPSACFSANASCFAFRYYLRRGRLLFLGHNFSRGAPPSSLKRFCRRAKNYFHHYILIGRQMSSKLPSNLRELYANFERKNRLACAFA